MRKETKNFYTNFTNLREFWNGTEESVGRGMGLKITGAFLGKTGTGQYRNGLTTPPAP